jgi:hypothetical protein
MSDILLEPLTLDAFSTRVSFEGGQLTVHLIGNADLRARKDLDAMLKRLHAEMLRLSLSFVVIDVTELEFMNSSCFKAFVSWLTDILDLPQEQRYKVRFRSNPQTLWQRRSLHALRSFALMIVSVEG